IGRYELPRQGGPDIRRRRDERRTGSLLREAVQSKLLVEFRVSPVSSAGPAGVKNGIKRRHHVNHFRDSPIAGPNEFRHAFAASNDTIHDDAIPVPDDGADSPGNDFDFHDTSSLT